MAQLTSFFFFVETNLLSLRLETLAKVVLLTNPPHLAPYRMVVLRPLPRQRIRQLWQPQREHAGVLLLHLAPVAGLFQERDGYFRTPLPGNLLCGQHYPEDGRPPRMYALP
jgi:hypothetical protein